MVLGRGGAGVLVLRVVLGRGGAGVLVLRVVLGRGGAGVLMLRVVLGRGGAGVLVLRVVLGRGQGAGPRALKVVLFYVSKGVSRGRGEKKRRSKSTE